MFEIKSLRFNHVIEHYEFDLENGDTVMVHEREFGTEDAIESTKGDLYTPVYEDVDYGDEKPEIIGFELV